MKNNKIQVLLLDDEEGIRSELNEFLSSREFSVFEASTPSEAFQILSTYPVDIAILDIRLPEISGIEVLQEIRRCYPNIANIMMSGHGDMETVIDALRMGAVDYFKKPFGLKDIYQTIEKYCQHLTFRKALNGDYYDHMLISNTETNEKTRLVAATAGMRKALEKMRLVARSGDTTVLITGESGTGKELIAKGIHQLSSRKDKPFVAVNCSSIPDELFESEFFGYTKGAFTSANGDKQGWFEAADKGTLFLDEIADMKPSLQSKLLRIMEDRNISRLGSTQLKKVDVRIIAATNGNLEEMVAQGKFRKDLYHRLNIFTIELPPLRERRESIPLLFAQFLEYYCDKLGMALPRVNKDVIDALSNYDFPGNVRELMHMVERALILCEGNRLTMEHFDHLQLKLTRKRTQDLVAHFAKPLDIVEKESIEVSLRTTGFNKSKTARLLNISRQALDRRIEKYKIELPN